VISSRCVSRIAAILAAAAAAAANLAGCGEYTPGDPFPVLVRRAGGAFVVDLRVDDEDSPRTAVIDVLAPLTILDQEASLPPLRRSTSLDIIAPRSATDPTPIVRTHFSNTVIRLHPCDPGGPCTIGSAGAPLAIGAVIGGDVLGGNSISFEPAADRIFVLPDVPGSDEARGRACDVVVSSPFYGGGTLLVGDTEISFTGSRVALGACLSPDPTAIDPTLRGVDAAFVLSTGVGISILGESRYQAWQRLADGPALDTLPPATALLPSGPVVGKLARIDRISLTGTSTGARAACRDVYSSYLMAQRDCVDTDGDNCPCNLADDQVRCGVAAIAELAPAAPIEFVVVEDNHPLLQALRTELRPQQPEIDGILGVDALADTAFDVDYQNSRVLIRCVESGCVARPAFNDINSRPVIAACVASAPGP
jgi:hypothetical protein